MKTLGLHLIKRITKPHLKTNVFRISSAILVIYFKSKLHFNEDDATVIYHAFSLFCYFTPLLGALLADQFLGKFKYAWGYPLMTSFIYGV